MQDRGLIGNQDNPHSKLKSVRLNDARCTGGFWADRQRLAHEVTLPRLWELLADPEEGHVLQNLRIAAGLEEGEFAFGLSLTTPGPTGASAR